MNKGFTMLEVIIAVSISSALLIVVGAMFQKSGESLEFFTSVGLNETSMTRALGHITAEVKQSSMNDIVIAQQSTQYDTVTITRSVGGDETEEVDTQFLVSIGTQELIKQISRYTVTGGIRTLINGSTTSSTIARHVSEFHVTVVGNADLLNIEMTMRVPVENGDFVQKTYETTSGPRL